MANNIWTGNGQKAKQVVTITPSNVGIGDIFTLTVGNKAVSFTATAATVANVCTGLVAAIAAAVTAGVREFAEFEATDGATKITLTANEAGRPFTVVPSHTDGNATATEDLVLATVTANGSENDFTNAAFVDTNDGFFDGLISNVPIFYGLDQSSIDLASLKVINGFRGPVGLPSYNPSGYAEYRGTELTFGTVTSLIVDSTQLQLMRINVGSNVCTFNLYGGTVEWRGTGANIVNVYGGTLRVAVPAGHVATVSQLTQYGGSVEISERVTLSNKPIIRAGNFKVVP